MFGYNKSFIILFSFLFCFFEPCFGVICRGNDGTVIDTDLSDLFRTNQIKLTSPLRFTFQFFNLFSVELDPSTIINHESNRRALIGFNQFNPKDIAYKFTGEDWFSQMMRAELTRFLVFSNRAEIDEYFVRVRALIKGQYDNHSQTCQCPDCVAFIDRREQETILSEDERAFIARRKDKELAILGDIERENLGRIISSIPPLLQPPAAPLRTELPPTDNNDLRPLALSYSTFFARRKVQIGLLVAALGSVVAFVCRSQEQNF